MREQIWYCLFFFLHIVLLGRGLFFLVKEKFLWVVEQNKKGNGDT